VIDDELNFEPHDWMAWDSFQSEADSFVRDVHMLVLIPLHAGISSLSQDTEVEMQKIEAFIEKASPENAERLAEDHANLCAELADQERFLRNLSLVALFSRLTHALHKMARTAETFAPINAKGYEGDNEFKKIWREYRERFGIDFGAKYIQFIEPLRNARNMIVHNGGDANEPIPITEIDFSKGDEGYCDPWFSKRYPQFVQDIGSLSARVRITEEQQNFAVESAIALVNRAAEQLRAKELEAEKLRRSSQK
jgi:hypothetical protein